MFIEFIKWIVIIGLLLLVNDRPNPMDMPRYWANVDIDTLARDAEHRTDTTLGVDLYIEEMEKLIEDLK